MAAAGEDAVKREIERGRLPEEERITSFHDATRSVVAVKPPRKEFKGIVHSIAKKISEPTYASIPVVFDEKRTKDDRQLQAVMSLFAPIVPRERMEELYGILYSGVPIKYQPVQLIPEKIVDLKPKIHSLESISSVERENLMKLKPDGSFLYNEIELSLGFETESFHPGVSMRLFKTMLARLKLLKSIFSVVSGSADYSIGEIVTENSIVEIYEDNLRVIKSPSGIKYEKKTRSSYNLPYYRLSLSAEEQIPPIDKTLRPKMIRERKRTSFTILENGVKFGVLDLTAVTTGTRQNFEVELEVLLSKDGGLRKFIEKTAISQRILFRVLEISYSPLLFPASIEIGDVIRKINALLKIGIYSQIRVYDHKLKEGVEILKSMEVERFGRDRIPRKVIKDLEGFADTAIAGRTIDGKFYPLGGVSQIFFNMDVREPVVLTEIIRSVEFLDVIIDKFSPVLLDNDSYDFPGFEYMTGLDNIAETLTRDLKFFMSIYGKYLKNKSGYEDAVTKGDEKIIALKKIGLDSSALIPLSLYLFFQYNISVREIPSSIVGRINPVIGDEIPLLSATEEEMNSTYSWFKSNVIDRTDTKKSLGILFLQKQEIGPKIKGELRKTEFQFRIDENISEYSFYNITTKTEPVTNFRICGMNNSRIQLFFKHLGVNFSKDFKPESITSVEALKNPTSFVQTASFEEFESTKISDKWVSRPVNVEPKELVNSKGGFAIALKFNGVRKFLFVDEEGAYLFYPYIDIEKIGYGDGSQIGGTVLDGEWFEETKTFFAFDCIFKNGNDIRFSRFDKRLYDMKMAVSSINLARSPEFRIEAKGYIMTESNLLYENMAVAIAMTKKKINTEPTTALSTRVEYIVSDPKRKIVGDRENLDLFRRFLEKLYIVRRDERALNVEHKDLKSLVDIIEFVNLGYRRLKGIDEEIDKEYLEDERTRKWYAKIEPLVIIESSKFFKPFGEFKSLEDQISRFITVMERFKILSSLPFVDIPDPTNPFLTGDEVKEIKKKTEEYYQEHLLKFGFSYSPVEVYVLSLKLKDFQTFYRKFLKEDMKGELVDDSAFQNQMKPAVVALQNILALKKEKDEISEIIKRRSVGFDGIILQPLGYYDETPLKWKPVDELTIDIVPYVVDGELFYYGSRGMDLLIPSKFQKIEIESDISPEDYGSVIEVRIAELQKETVMVDGEETDITRKIVLQKTRNRFDKDFANSAEVISKVIRDIEDPLTEEVLAGGSLKLVRAAHNQVKMKVLGEVADFIKILKSKPEEARVSSTSLLDIGSGRGGDAQKWKFEKLSVYAIEPNPVYIEQMKKRIASMKEIEIKILQAGGEDTEKIVKFVENKLFSRVTSFDVLTFFFRDETRLRNLATTFKETVATGGELIITFMDGGMIRKAISGHYRSDSIVLSQTGMKKTLSFTTSPAFPPVKRLLTVDWEREPIGVFGSQVEVSFFGNRVIVEKQTEWLTDVDAVQRIFSEYGFKLKLIENIGKLSTLPAPLLAISQLYKLMRFVKVE